MVKVFGVIGFAVGAIPLLALTFFSAGATSEGLWGYIALAWGATTLVLLALTSRANKNYRILVVLQILLLAGVLIEAFSDASLYIGT